MVYRFDCSHILHAECFKEYIDNGSIRCPMCKKSLVHIDNSMIDNLILENPISNQMIVSIHCYECGTDGTSPFHPIGRKCQNCGTYNTEMSLTPEQNRILLMDPR